MSAIRQAVFRDAIAIYHLIKKYPLEVLPRSLSDITTNIDRFFVYCNKEGKIVATVAYKILPEIGKETEHIMEIVSLSVSKRYQGRGIGKALVETIIMHIQQYHPTKIILLTFSPRFFAKLGFTRISKRRLYNKIYLGCINCTKYTSPLECPEVAMALKMDA
ncbi:MAG: GNAT family N-acetyltransferase [Fibrobacterota bacterium]